MPGRRDDESDKPLAAGWYPDPWSATGEGERYYDGKHWGSSARPLARHSSAASVTPIKVGKARRRRRSITNAGGIGPRVRGLAHSARTNWKPIAFLLTLILLAWGLPKLRDRGHSNAIRIESEGQTTPSTVAERPPPSQEESPKPLGAPAAVPAGSGDFQTLFHQPKDPATPVGFDPCRPIHYVVNPAGAPADDMALITKAIARVETATGLHFVFDGTTQEKPDKQREIYQPDRYNPARWAPVLVAWSDEKSFAPLAGYIEGIGEPETWYADPTHLVIVTGAVVFDRAQLSAKVLPDRREVEAVMLHEFGHLVGLDHTADKRQIMFSESEFNVLDYGLGDRRGLALLGRQPCFSNV